MSCVESETKQVILAKLRKEIEKRVDDELDSKLTALASRKCMKTDMLHLESIENELYEKYKNIIKTGDEVNFTPEIFFTSYDGYDFDDYEAMIESISSDKSAPIKLKSLHKLLDSQMIDVTHRRWHRLSKNLQHCLISTNDEVFRASLKMHYKLISCPGSSCEGYLSMVQGLEIIFNNRCFLNRQHFDVNNKLQNRALKVVKVLLKTESFVLKNLVQAKLSCFEEFLVVFFMLVCRGQENSTLLEILSVLDSKACWFCELCYSVQTRNAVLKRCANIIKIAVSLLIGHTNKLKSNLKKKIEISKQSQAIHIIIEVFKYEKGKVLFPIRLPCSPASVGINQLVITVLVRLNESHVTDDMKRLLIGFVENLNENFDHETLKTLLTPFNTNNMLDLKQIYQTVEDNSYVICILNVLCSKKPLDLLYGYHKPKSSKIKQLHCMPSTSPLQVVCDLAIACIRHFINICELEHQVKETVIQLLHCCKLFYAIHPVSFLMCNPDKFICCLKDFHDTIGNYNVNLHYKLDLSNILSFFVANYPATLKLLSSKTVLLNEILNCASDQVLLLLPIMANDKDGCEILRNNAIKITKPFLERVWMEEDNISQESFEKALSEFLQVIQVVALNFKTFEIFVTSENEATLIGSDSKPATLGELLETAVNCSSEEDLCVSYVALCTVKVLLTNPDVILYLEHVYNLQVCRLFLVLFRFDTAF